MDRLACVDVPALPLQLLLGEHPEWAGLAAAVVEEDRPQGLVLWVNNRAREAGVLPGLRYGAALSLAPELRAGVVAPEAIRLGVDGLIERLRSFTPDIEPSAIEPGVFWLDASGLERVFPSSEAWAQALRQDLAAAGFVAAVVVGFRRFGTYAAAKALKGRKAVVFETPEREDAVVRQVALGLLGLPPGVRDALAKLGVHHVGEFLGLPAAGLLKRFGPEAHALHRFASGELELPLTPVPAVVPLVRHLELDYREDNAERLVFVVKPLVDELLSALRGRGRALTELALALTLDRAPERLERIRTAEPTLSSVTVMELVKLRLTAAPLPSPVLAVSVTAESVAATAEQLSMFDLAPRRDPAAAARAFARLRAAFGSEDVVVKAVLRDRHSPEGSFGWEPLARLGAPRPRPETPGVLVRRILGKPEPCEPPLERLNGPYRIAGGWWRGGIDRDYYFTETKRGELLWVYYDHDRRRWFLQGEIT